MSGRIFLLFAIYVCGHQAVQAQSYGTALGLRFGNDNVKRTMGITFQQRLLKRVTIEGIVQSDFSYNHTLHGLIKVHQPLVTKRLNFYSGGGFSMGMEQSKFNDPLSQTIIITTGNKTLSGDLVVGLELTMLKYNISVDYKPNFNITGRNPWYLGQVGISGRAVLVTGAKQNKRWREKNREKRREDRKERQEDNKFLNIFKKSQT
ncbi:MAG: hypothetical protein OEW75_11865 [Cyclobacteriaceae bacterium]|nr:hypothetical protein [Cyclobacteriaceae bacterium]